MHKPKTLEAAVEKVRITEGNHSSSTGGQVASAPVTGIAVRGFP